MAASRAQSAVTGSTSSATSLTVSHGQAPAPGNLEVLIVGVAATNTALAPDATWTKAADTGSQNTGIQVFYRPAPVGASTSVTTTLANGATGAIQAVLDEWTGFSVPGTYYVQLAVTGSSPNLCHSQMAGFEVDASTPYVNLNNVSSLAVSTLQADTGTHSLLVTGNATAGNFSWKSNTIAVYPNTQYTFSGSARKGDATNQNATAFVYWFTDMTGTVFATTSSNNSGATGITNAGWTRLSITATSPGNAHAAAISFTVNETASGEKAFCDSMQLAPGTSTTYNAPPATASLNVGTTSGQVELVLFAVDVAQAVATTPIASGGVTQDTGFVATALDLAVDEPVVPTTYSAPTLSWTNAQPYDALGVAISSEFENLPNPIPPAMLLGLLGLDAYLLAPPPPIAPVITLAGSAVTFGSGVEAATGQGVNLGHAPAFASTAEAAAGKGINLAHGVALARGLATAAITKAGTAVSVARSIARAAGVGVGVGKATGSEHGLATAATANLGHSTSVERGLPTATGAMVNLGHAVTQERGFATAAATVVVVKAGHAVGVARGPAVATATLVTVTAGSATFSARALGRATPLAIGTGSAPWASRGSTATNPTMVNLGHAVGVAMVLVAAAARQAQSGSANASARALPVAVGPAASGAQPLLELVDGAIGIHLGGILYTRRP